MFKKILIANRGEIAIRIINAARELNIESIAIYHSIDKKMPFVRYADYAIELISDSPKAGYLDMQQIIKIAKENKAEAIHPGYGFLSENANFSRLCKENGIKFIGPYAESIEAMGSKTGAREIMQKAGVPIVPGHNSRITDFDEAIKIATKIGFPVLLKAAAGGGGKGMRVVEKAEEFKENYEAAQREAIKSFGDDLVYMEKYILNPKHIEVQIIADEHDNCVFLAERDCSIQRRHQKVIEEAPSNVLDEELRAKMGKVAIEAAKACNYVNAGTIEFLLDKDKNFYFLEMNTRLQVEHPVTEMVTGIDLAKEQIKVAAGYELSFKQEDIKLKGHSFECRIYAEDPLNNFMPDIGNIDYLREPFGNGVRVDTGIENNSEISLHFDPMLSKLITFGKDRDDAAEKMLTALKNYQLLGFSNIIPFLIDVFEDDRFRNGYFDTGYIPNHYDFEALKAKKYENENELAAIVTYLFNRESETIINTDTKPSINNWKMSNLNMRKE